MNKRDDFKINTKKKKEGTLKGFMNSTEGKEQTNTN